MAFFHFVQVIKKVTECEMRNDNDNMAAGDMTFTNVNKILKVSFIDILCYFLNWCTNFYKIIVKIKN